MANILHIGSADDYAVYSSLLSPAGHTVTNKASHTGSLQGYDLLILSTFEPSLNTENTIDAALFSEGVPVLMGFDNGGMDIGSRWLYKRGLVLSNDRTHDASVVTIAADEFNQLFGTIYEEDVSGAERTGPSFIDRYTPSPQNQHKVFLRSSGYTAGIFWHNGVILNGMETIAPLVHMGWLMFSIYQPTLFGKNIILSVVNRLLKKFKISGEVRQKENGMPVPNVVVSAMTRASAAVLGRDLTDVDGKYTIFINDTTPVTLMASNPNQEKNNAFSDNVSPEPINGSN